MRVLFSSVRERWTDITDQVIHVTHPARYDVTIHSLTPEQAERVYEIAADEFSRHCTTRRSFP